MESALRERLKKHLSQTLFILGEFHELKDYVNDKFAEKLIDLNLSKMSSEELLDSREKGLLALRDLEERQNKTLQVIIDELLGKIIIAEIETELRSRNKTFMGGSMQYSSNNRQSKRLQLKKRVNYSPRKRRRIHGGLWDKIKFYY